MARHDPTAFPAQARPAAICDRQLAELRKLAHAARRGDITTPESEYLLAACGPLLDELIEYRQVAVAIIADATRENVIPLTPGGAA